MKHRNPFRPTAGATPPILVGREGQLAGFREALANGPGDPGLLSFLTGARGVGKTAMLTEFGTIAVQEGWRLIEDTATPGLLNRIAERVESILVEERGRKGGAVTSLTIGGFGFSRTPSEAAPRPWRERIEELLDILARRDSGLVLSIDEIHAIAKDELVQLAAEMQHFIRHARPIALVMAGLPKAVADLLNDGVSTFLRRAERIELGPVAVCDVEDALAQTFEESGVTIDLDDVRLSAEATQGYPFMIQLVGYHVWRRADQDARLDHNTVRAGIDAACVRLGALVHETALADLSEVDRSFLVALAHEDGPTSFAALASTLGREVNYAAVYRDRLIKAGLIRAVRYGYVDFALPYLRDYLREHGAYALAPLPPAGMTQ